MNIPTGSNQIAPIPDRIPRAQTQNFTGRAILKSNGKLIHVHSDCGFHPNLLVDLINVPFIKKYKGLEVHVNLLFSQERRRDPELPPNTPRGKQIIQYFRKRHIAVKEGETRIFVEVDNKDDQPELQEIDLEDPLVHQTEKEPKRKRRSE